MKRGFTLIELLAVIVILAILSLIVVPMVIRIINDTKKSSIERSAELYINGVELAISKQNLQEKFNPESCEVKEDGNIICDEKEIIVEMKGEKPKEGTLEIENSNVKSYSNLKFDNSYITMDENGEINISNKKSVKTIFFTFIEPSADETEEYEVDEGTTWEEFLHANMLDIYNAISENDNYYLVDLDTDEKILISDVIKNGGTYSFNCESEDHLQCTHVGGNN